MKLKELFPQYSNSDSQISAIEIDSRLVKSGAVFFALKGHATDGTKFIQSALDKGANAVVCGQDYESSDARIIKVNDVYETLIASLQKFYPDLPENIFAVTGTNGKTSVAYFIQQLLEILGKKSAAIGTTGIKISDSSIEKSLTSFALTTPDIVSLYKNLSILKQNGIDNIAIEASSIGLEQKRLAGLKISLGAFTNFTQDHLDYHHSMEKYFECKMLLFREVLQKGNIAVLNADDASFKEIKKIAKNNNLQIFSYTCHPEQSEGSQKISLSLTHEIIHFVQDEKEWKYPFKINLAGDFQKANLLCALLSVISYYNLDSNQTELLIKNLSQIKPAEGRMQLAGSLKNNAQIFIDYAHTPDALQNVLETAQKMNHNNLYVLFGCGGDRDKSKRPQMGKIASDLADFVIVSDDNPRTENAEEIRKEILASCNLSKTTQVENRKDAIKQTIARLQANDILIIAGKGHEKYQIIGGEKFEFDEEKIVKEIIDSKL